MKKMKTLIFLAIAFMALGTFFLAVGDTSAETDIQNGTYLNTFGN